MWPRYLEIIRNNDVEAGFVHAHDCFCPRSPIKNAGIFVHVCLLSYVSIHSVSLYNKPLMLKRRSYRLKKSVLVDFFAKRCLNHAHNFLLNFEF